MKVNLKLYDTPFLVIEDLINGRLDAAVMGDPPIKEALKSKRPIKMIGPLGMDDQVWAYAVRKGDKELLDALNEGLTRLKKSEKWNELIVKFDIK
jgi:ABC-type amino acid transport substrate-binding protein